MTIDATILIPTHDHGPIIRYALGCALGQTVRDVEVFVVGDGVPDVTRAIVRDFSGRDSRVRFFDNPKGPRSGEVHRHAALREARGQIVCYLSDDDLYFEDHVATMLGLLENADFAGALGARITPDGTVFCAAVDARNATHRRLMRTQVAGFGLSSGAHTLELYRRLPFGWRTTPAGQTTDSYMWSQILATPGCRATSSFHLTAVHLPSMFRTHMTLEEREAETARWADEIRRPGARERLVEKLVEWFVAERVRLDEMAIGRLRNRMLASPRLRRLALAAGRRLVRRGVDRLIPRPRPR
jgi:glycosyl transferase family 2